jgi:hypothetical protein
MTEGYGMSDERDSQGRRLNLIGQPILTAEEIEAISPEERTADLETRKVWNPALLPEDYVDRMKAWAFDEIQSINASPTY